ncbi:unnamed protein product [Spirodela intermedia]|uniref:Non-structural maintenance of chromosomes element 4 n=1 Tax=Spirodela intermedia TaxID=51605 RepID=A0A7I8JSB0_SPIIN|nr:unnamed protein product [Spirodela intermedia]CAA6672312.1 unnamed protein product [Spirodela intermedia]
MSGKVMRETLKEELLRLDFLLGRVNGLHERAQKPRDQVADAEALLTIADRLCSSLKSIQEPQSVLPSTFISCLLQRHKGSCGETISWVNMGLAASQIIGKAPGIQTMIGTMEGKMTRRKTFTRSKRPRASVLCCPEEIEDATSNEETGTQRNVSIMFDILRQQKRVRLEKLVLNRASFSETVENIFALSFLVKDGRSEITVDDGGAHLVCNPRNAPSAAAVASREIIHRQFVFRFDVSDWKLMKGYVVEGEELMPRRGLSEFLRSLFIIKKLIIIQTLGLINI